MPSLAFEDFPPGREFRYGRPPVTRDELVAFARQFDAQPFHLDEEAARETFVGELIGSGWQSCGILMRLLADNVLAGSTCMGAPGIEEVRWLRPVRPGDALSVRQTVLEAKASRSRPGMGLVRFRFELLDGEDKPVQEQTNWIMFATRDAPEREPAPSRPPAAALPPPPPPPPVEPSPFLDEVVIGARTELGSYDFTPESVVAYAREFDPQPFHLSDEAARRSHFGALCASGWHTGAAWMACMVETRKRAAQAAETQGRPAPRLGPSPGFKDLRWSKPVYAGDRISFSSTVEDVRASASRPGWGLVFHRNAGVNQHGEEVFSFHGCVFLERRGG